MQRASGIKMQEASGIKMSRIKRVGGDPWASGSPPSVSAKKVTGIKNGLAPG